MYATVDFRRQGCTVLHIVSLIAAAAPAVDAAPAGGAALGQVLIGTAVSLSILVALFVLGLRHRAGHRTLHRLARPLVRLTGLPAWSVLPMAVAVAGFVLAGVGFVWDVSLHIGQGRDTGPFGTPAHYLILAGIYLFVAAAWFAVAMPVGERRPSWIRITRSWYVPPAAVAMLATSFFSMSGFPLDDIWHNLFGQDVTLWGPTHLMMITGGLFLFFALTLLVREGREAVRDGLHPELRPVPEWMTRMLGVRAASVAVVGVTVAYLQEFAFGVPQFRLLFDPTIMAFGAAFGFTVAALAFGRGRALKTWAASVITLGALTIVVGPVLGESTHHFPLFLVPALCVEASFRIPWARPGGYRFAAVAGALIGTVGVAGETLWSHVWMPIAWPWHLLPEAMLRSVPVAIAGAVLAAFVAAGLQAKPGAIATRPGSWRVPAGAILVLVVSMVALLPTQAPRLSGDLTLTQVRGGAKPLVRITVRVSDPRAVEDADWFYPMSWQGKEQAVHHGTMQRVGPGVWRSSEAFPVYGTWKTFLRLQKGDVMESIPVYAPADSAIPVPGIAATNGPRAFQRDLRLLQRERKPDVPNWLFRGASIGVAGATLLLAWLLGWA
ncbi:MAG: hypothetical protein JWM31_3263, partial [Solirubrobacterales bacterium]|nr:hypothetical protein [Solirubrobacterales bacterium]